jgi:hypothetical protein
MQEACDADDRAVVLWGVLVVGAGLASMEVVHAADKAGSKSEVQKSKAPTTQKAKARPVYPLIFSAVGSWVMGCVGIGVNYRIMQEACDADDAESSSAVGRAGGGCRFGLNGSGARGR